MSHRIVFELCAQTPGACVAARLGGADRIEICTNIQVSGLTPDRALIEDAIRLSGLPVHVLLRPKPDRFVFSRQTFTLVADSLQMAKSLGACGVCIGFLNPDRTVAVGPTRELVEMARPMAVTFHRAFDETPDPQAALEAVIETGCTRVLTSGGAANVLAGAPVLARLVTLAAGRIEVAAGGGLTLENAHTVARVTGARHYHGSLRQNGLLPGSASSLAQRIESMIGILSEVQDCAPPPERNARLSPAG